MRKLGLDSCLFCATLVVFLNGIIPLSEAAEQDEFDDLSCVKYVVIIDRLAQLRDDGFPKSSAYLAANQMNVVQFTQAVASVYEFQKDMRRDELDLYALGWCEGQSDALAEEDDEADTWPEQARLKPRHPVRSPAGQAI